MSERGEIVPMPEQKIMTREKIEHLIKVLELPGLAETRAKAVDDIAQFDPNERDTIRKASILHYQDEAGRAAKSQAETISDAGERNKFFSEQQIALTVSVAEIYYQAGVHNKYIGSLVNTFVNAHHTSLEWDEYTDLFYDVSDILVQHLIEFCETEHLDHERIELDERTDNGAFIKSYTSAYKITLKALGTRPDIKNPRKYLEEKGFLDANKLEQY